MDKTLVCLQLVPSVLSDMQMPVKPPSLERQQHMRSIHKTAKFRNLLVASVSKQLQFSSGAFVMRSKQEASFTSAPSAIRRPSVNAVVCAVRAL